MRKGGSKPKTDIAEPTPEQISAFEIVDITDKRNGGGTVTIGKAWRRVPMIYLLALAGTLNIDEYKALKHYRHHAELADRSPIRDSLCLQRGGRGNGPTFSTLNAVRVRDDCS
jgi:hypothetical protein